MPDLAYGIGMFVGFCPVIYVMKYLPVTQGQGTLPFFNGISMGLATFFVGIYFTYGGIKLDGDLGYYLLPVITAIPAIGAGLLGAVLGWFNVTILFPRVVTKTSAQPAGA